MNNFPIGVIDSGSGGLSIWKDISVLLPNESIIYIGDHAYLPYSEKTTECIQNRVLKLIQFLLNKRVKLIVIACNTATVAGIDLYRQRFPDIPIVGVVPVIKTAATLTRTNNICVLSTKYTAKSNYQMELIKEFAPKATVFAIGSSRLVEYIESESDRTVSIIKELQEILAPVRRRNIDTIVLGCTHFPFIEKEIKKVMGLPLSFLDSGPAVARQVNRILEHNGLYTRNTSAKYVFYTTGNKKKVSIVYNKLLEQPVVVLMALIA